MGKDLVEVSLSVLFAGGLVGKRRWFLEYAGAISMYHSNKYSFALSGA